jgi:hypothetical protein
LALHQAVRVRVPLWFDEGYATMASGQWDVLDRIGLHLAVARGSPPGLRSLDAELRASQMSADAAYALAATAVMELARRNPTGTLEPLFEQLGAGVGFGDAVVATTGLSLDRFDEAWRKSVRARFGLITWTVGSGIWLGMTLLVLLAYRARRRRDVPRRAALDVGWVLPPDDLLPGDELSAVEDNISEIEQLPPGAEPLDHQRPSG